MSFYLLQQVIDSNIPEACSSFCQLVSMGEAIIISLWLTLSYNPDISSFSLSRSLWALRAATHGRIVVVIVEYVRVWAWMEGGR